MFSENHRVMVPSHSLDTALTADNVHYIRTTYPQKLFLCCKFNFPTGKNIPPSPVVLYFSQWYDEDWEGMGVLRQGSAAEVSLVIISAMVALVRLWTDGMVATCWDDASPAWEAARCASATVHNGQRPPTVVLLHCDQYIRGASRKCQTAQQYALRWRTDPGLCAEGPAMNAPFDEALFIERFLIQELDTGYWVMRIQRDQSRLTDARFTVNWNHLLNHMDSERRDMGWRLYTIAADCRPSQRTSLDERPISWSPWLLLLEVNTKHEHLVR